MGCCCAKSEEVQEDGERTPLLTEKHLTADSVTGGGDTPTKTDLTQDAEPEQESQPQDEASDTKIPDEVTPSPVDLKRLQIPEQDEKMETAVLRYHNHLDHYGELQRTTSRIREMYPEHNKDQTIIGSFAHVCEILGTRSSDILSVNEKDPTCVQLIYDEQRIPEAALPAVEAFNKASKLVKDLLHEGPLLAVAIDDVIFAENVTRAEIAKMSQDKDPSVVNQCLDHYLYDIRQFYYIKTMLEKIKDETHSIHSQLHGAAQDIRTKPSDDSVAVADDLAKLDSAITQPSDVSVSGDKETTEIANSPESSAAQQSSDVSASSQVAVEAEQTPDVSAAKETPDVSAAKETPDVSVTEQPSDVSASSQVSVEAEQTPDVSATEHTPDVSAAEQTPDLSVTEQSSDVSATEHTPDVSAAEQTLDVSVTEQTPDVSEAKQTPDVSITEQSSDVSASSQVAVEAEQTPDVTAPEQTPDVSPADQTLDVSATDVSTSEKRSDHTPDMSHDNLSPGDNSMDQRTADTTLDNTADMSADFRADESASFLTDEGEVSYTSNEEFDGTRESFTDSKSFTEQ